MRTVLWSSLDSGGDTTTVDAPIESVASPPLPISEPPAAREKPGGPSPFAVVGVALAAGAALAKWIDWRGRRRED